jgi:sulfatase modifying factor 1
MRTHFLLLKIIAKAALHLSGVGGIWTMVEDVPELANNVWNDWKAARTASERKADTEEVAALEAENSPEIRRIVDEVAGNQPESVRQDLAALLSQVPGSIRQTLRRPTDPTGRTLSPALEPRSAQDLIPFLAVHRPRFKKGDRPIAGADWVLDELLGIGGYGEVWKALHTHIDDFQPVALKFCIDPLARERLLKHEGKHPGIVQLQQTYLGADPPCLQYEYVSGGTLANFIKDYAGRDAIPSPEKVARLLLAIAKPVAFAHQLNPPIVHRDLKPANILLQGTNGSTRAKIADFGIGGIATAAVVRATRQPTHPSLLLTKAVSGSHSPLYASPEQAAGGLPDPRDDIHALGVIWYQMLTGNLTTGPSSGDAWKRKLAARGMSAALISLLVSCLEEADERIANAGILCERIENELSPSREPLVPPRPTPRPVNEPLITNTLGMKLALIPAGEFEMSSDDSGRSDEKPKHKVKITRPFYLGTTEVTVGQFRRFVDASGYKTDAERNGNGYGWNAAESTDEQDPKYTWRSPGFAQGDDHPVVLVSHNDGLALCDWLKTQEGATYRLPTEAEWEYACRSGGKGVSGSGDDEAELDRVAWYGAKSGIGTHPVGKKQGNAFGLYDMLGNAWEWCGDWYDSDYYAKLPSPVTDPAGPSGGSYRVSRGGSWGDGAEYCRAAYRLWRTPGYCDCDLGLRLARVPSGM